MAKRKMYIAAENNDLETIKLCIYERKDKKYDKEGLSVADKALEIANRNKNYNISEYIIKYASITPASLLILEDLPKDLGKLIIEKFPEDSREYILQRGVVQYFPIIKNFPNIYITKIFLCNTISAEYEGHFPEECNEILEFFQDNQDLYIGDMQFIKYNRRFYSKRISINTLKIIFGSQHSKPYNYGLNYLIKEQYDKLELIDYLISLGADPNLAIEDCPSPFCLTSNHNYNDIFNYLLNYGGELNLSNNNQLPYLYYLFCDLTSRHTFNVYGAQYTHHLIMALKNGADPFITIYPPDVPDGIPLLHYFIDDLIWEEDTVQYILDIIALFVDNMNVLDNWGRNLLHYVITTNNDRVNIYSIPKIVKYLINLGVDPNQMATINNHKKVVNAKMHNNLPPGYGKTPAELLQNLIIAHEIS